MIGHTTVTDDSQITNIDPDYPHSWWTIQVPSTDLPSINMPTLIDGYSQGAGTTQAASLNTSSTGDNAILRIELDQSQMVDMNQGANIINGDDTTIEGLDINGDFVPGSLGLNSYQNLYVALIVGGNNDSIVGDFFGTDISGTLSVPNDIGVAVGGSYCQIGVVQNGTGQIDYCDRNIISGNVAGIALSAGSRTEVYGNLIGTDRYGNPLGNYLYGIVIDNGDIQSQIGGDTPGLGNIIADNGGKYDANPGDTVLGGGVVVLSQDLDWSGNPFPLAEGDSILGNAIYGNASVGIDLGQGYAYGTWISFVTPDTGVTLNDSFGHDGPNHYQDFPVLSTVDRTGLGTTITGSLSDTAPDTEYHIEFFANASGGNVDTKDPSDPNLYGQGQTFLGYYEFNSGAGGTVDFTATGLAAIPVGEVYLSSTATNLDTGDTSEFSADLVIPPPTIVANNSTATTVYGQTALNTGTWSDPNQETVSLTASAGTVTENANGTWSWSFSAGHGSVGSQTVTITATNTDGLQATTTFVLTVNPAMLVITPNSISKVYGQTITFAGTEFTTSGLVNGDVVTSVTLTSTGALATAPVSGSPYPIVASAAVGSGLGNYTITYDTGTLAVNPKALSITANSISKVFGQTVTFAGTEFTTSGLVNGDTVTNVTPSSAGAAATAPVSNSPYPIVPSAAAGSGLSNYTISYINGSLTVVPNVGLLLLNPSGSGTLNVSGNASLNVSNNGVIVVDSSNAAAAVASGNATVTDAETDLTGGLSVSGSAAFQGTIDQGKAALADPLAGLAAPAQPSNQFTAISYSGTLQPGTYVDGITVSGNNSATLQPGIYYVKGSGLTVSGNATVTGTGVMIYSTGLTGSSPTSINISGSAIVTLTPPTSGTYQGIVFFQDRSSKAAINISGNGVLNTTGTEYAPGATVTLSGDDVTDNPVHTSLGSQWIFADLTLSGNAHVTITADAGNRTQNPNAFMIAGGPIVPAVPVAPLTQPEVHAAIHEAVVLWGAAGLDAGTLQALSRATVTITPLPAPYLGLAAPGAIYLDPTAEGYGWFTSISTTASPPSNEVDLLTVVAHELGHLFGLMDGNGTVLMAPDLSPGVRILPSAADLLAPHMKLTALPITATQSNPSQSQSGLESLNGKSPVDPGATQIQSPFDEVKIGQLQFANDFLLLLAKAAITNDDFGGALNIVLSAPSPVDSWSGNIAFTPKPLLDEITWSEQVVTPTDLLNPSPSLDGDSSAALDAFFSLGETW